MKYELIDERDHSLSLLSQVLKNRGIKDIEHYLHVNDSDLLDPLLLEDMDKAGDLLLKHAEKLDKVFLIVDSDADGMTSSAIIYNYCHCIWPEWVDTWKYFLHSGKQHGLGDCIDLALKYDLIIAPDSSSNNYTEIDKLKEQNIDVLILDHHEAPYKSPNAITVNNQLCDYPTKSLSGAGIVYKFCKYLDTLLNVDLADRYMDLAATGCIADMMSMKDCEIHRLAEVGLNNIHNPFIKTIVDQNEFTLKGHLNPKGVSFSIAPVINSVMRIGTIENKTLLFKSMLESLSYTEIPSGKRGHIGEPAPLVEEAIRIASNIRAKQNKLRDSRFEILVDIIESENLYNNKIIAVCQEEVSEEESGLTGLTANQIMAKYKHPILLLRKTTHDGEEFWEGSGRCPSNCGIKDLRQMLEDSGLVAFAQGHAAAFGVSIPAKNLEALIDYTNEILKDNDFSTSYMVDDIIDYKLLDINDIVSVHRARDLWTQGIEEPYIAIQNITVKPEMVMITDKVLKFTTDNLQLVKFKPTDEEMMKMTSLQGTYTLTCVGTCSHNEYDDMPQILIADYELKQNMLWDF